MRKRPPVRVTAWERLVAWYATDTEWMRVGMLPGERRWQTTRVTIAAGALVVLIATVYLSVTQMFVGRSRWPIVIAFILIFVGMLWRLPRTSRYFSHKWRLLVRDRSRVSWLDEAESVYALKRRREHWIRKLETASPAWHHHPKYILVMTLFVGAVMGWNVLRGVGVLPGNLMSALPFLMMAVLAGFALDAKLSRRRYLARIKSDLCIDCGYSLGELPAWRLQTWHGESISAGPERCPECGCVWPMVPPRALEDWAG